MHTLQVCLELQQNWMESGVSEDAVSGHIQVRSHLGCDGPACPLHAKASPCLDTKLRTQACAAAEA